MDTGELHTTAALAYLELQDHEVESLAKAVSQMLEYFSKMMEVDVENLEPTTHALLKQNRVRQDTVIPSDLADSLIGRAPELEDRFIVIPNVL